MNAKGHAVVSASTSFVFRDRLLSSEHGLNAIFRLVGPCPWPQNPVGNVLNGRRANSGSGGGSLSALYTFAAGPVHSWGRVLTFGS